MDTTPKTKTKEEILASLNEVEHKLVQVVKMASEAVSHVSCKDASSDNVENFNKKSNDFLQLVKDVHMNLVSHSDIVSNYRAYGKSTYGAQKDLELTLAQINQLQV